MLNEVAPTRSLLNSFYVSRKSWVVEDSVERCSRQFECKKQLVKLFQEPLTVKLEFRERSVPLPSSLQL